MYSLTIPSHAASPIIHIHSPYRDAVVDSCGREEPELSLPQLHEIQPSFDIAGEDRLLQDIVDEVFAQDVWITRASRMCVQELVELRLSITLAVTAALSCKVCESAAGVIKAVFKKLLTKRN